VAAGALGPEEIEVGKMGEVEGAEAV